MLLYQSSKGKYLKGNIMKNQYKSELEGMGDFYEDLEITPDYSCNTDGRLNGTLIEFKLNDNSRPTDQLKRYLKAYNSAALPIPRYSLFITINQHKFEFVDNLNFTVINSGTWKKPEDLKKYLNKDAYLKGYIDEYSIIAYNDKFYSEHLLRTKEDFIEEIKNPTVLNIEPYDWNETGDMERDLLDCLGSTELKKRLGAFFTPDQYVKTSTEYLRNAIKRVPEDHDYIIVDRCAGTGNLEKFLTPDELSHCILNTYAYAEWTTLMGLYDGRVRKILPENREYKDSDGLLTDGNALTEGFNEKLSSIIRESRKKVDGKLVVIFYENPPYSLANPKNRKGGFKNTFVASRMSGLNLLTTAKQDMVMGFIWSAYDFFKPDFYILYAPIKYWKHTHLIDKKLVDGYLCNRKDFHATEAAISLISWENTDTKNDSLNFESDCGCKTVKKSYKSIVDIAKQIKKESNENDCIGTWLSTCPIAYHIGNGFYQEENHRDSRNQIPLSKNNILISLPIFTANCYKSKDYTEKEVIMKSGDGGIAYQNDKEFLMDCLVWSCLTNQNKCVSNDQVRNELCLNQGTEADKLTNIMTDGLHTLMDNWNDMLTSVKKTDEYNPKYTYGLHQITKEINVKEKTGGYTKKNEPVLQHKYPILNTMIKEFKKSIDVFYTKYITPKLFKYELLK